MKTILVTGAGGFIGKNLIAALKRQDQVALRTFDIDDDQATLRTQLKEADFVFHLAGVNRPPRAEEFETGNVGLTKTLVGILEDVHRFPPVVFSSSTQATLPNPYGISKKKAEVLLEEYGQKNKARVWIYRLPNVFGKWCRPNYNSVVATFCHNISRDLDISISDPDKEVELVYIDEVIENFIELTKSDSPGGEVALGQIPRTFKIRLGQLAEQIRQFRDIRKTLVLPDFADDLTRYLYATFLSYLGEDAFAYRLSSKSDPRGSLTELLKSGHFGQIFVSRTFPGVKRGNHYHQTKIEKFCVVKGKAAVRLRRLLDDQILTYRVSGDRPEIVDIPPGYTHSIENTGEEDLITLFWADEIFNPEKQDTFHEDV
jgi:UDP-2-acetamido-2,6-beta-L-arabino-hexul-4-ose reductase